MGDSFSIMERLRRAFGFNSEVGSILTGRVFAEDGGVNGCGSSACLLKSLLCASYLV